MSFLVTGKEVRARFAYMGNLFTLPRAGKSQVCECKRESLVQLGRGVCEGNEVEMVGCHQGIWGLGCLINKVQVYALRFKV